MCTSLSLLFSLQHQRRPSRQLDREPAVPHPVSHRCHGVVLSGGIHDLLHLTFLRQPGQPDIGLQRAPAFIIIQQNDELLASAEPGEAQQIVFAV